MEGKYSNILEIFEGGAGREMAGTLLDCIERYATSMEAEDGTVPAARDYNNLCNLVWLLRSVLQDCCGLQL